MNREPGPSSVLAAYALYRVIEVSRLYREALVDLIEDNPIRSANLVAVNDIIDFWQAPLREGDIVEYITSAAFSPLVGTIGWWAGFLSIRKVKDTRFARSEYKKRVSLWDQFAAGAGPLN